MSITIKVPTEPEDLSKTLSELALQLTQEYDVSVRLHADADASSSPVLAWTGSDYALRRLLKKEYGLTSEEAWEQYGV